jgi:hypothetical protein
VGDLRGMGVCRQKKKKKRGVTVERGREREGEREGNERNERK